MTSDPDAAARFYGAVVGWHTRPWGEGDSYTTWMTGSRAMGGLMGQRSEAGTAPRPQWFCYIGTADVDATVRQAVELGGRVMRPAWDIPNVGRIAFLSDPQGGPFAVMTPSPADGDLGDPADLGNFSWHELLSTNWQAAWEFYSRLFDWHKGDAMDMGPLGTYQMFGIDGHILGGMFTKAAATPGPAFWLPYANVPDAKKAGANITKLGGTIINGPMEVPGGGWIVAGLDQQGAAFAVYSKPRAARPAGASARGPRKIARRKPAASRTSKARQSARPSSASSRGSARRRAKRGSAKKRSTKQAGKTVRRAPNARARSRRPRRGRR